MMDSENRATRSSAGSVEPGLERSLGVRSLAASILNITVGGGIFLYPAVIAGGLGAAAWLAYVVCAVAFGLIVLCFADAGRQSIAGQALPRHRPSSHRRCRQSAVRSAAPALCTGCKRRP